MSSGEHPVKFLHWLQDAIQFFKNHGGCFNEQIISSLILQEEISDLSLCKSVMSFIKDYMSLTHEQPSFSQCFLTLQACFQQLTSLQLSCNAPILNIDAQRSCLPSSGTTIEVS
ncbi:hypothetical protein O181_067534 [Austropuccinia psidii MF-1]|uniref:Uncharacterized protein n=1 Tax=Austropuccinia psidii MF-1 TaxID=1389203 RepID=A0A9Q3EV50_9BASI|nr:hypothetical protein [Austropuccinia psidii MF-1]